MAVETLDQEIQTQNEYRVLARKYRPQNFDELIGQDALVRTLKNAIESNRIAHAYMLTGIRGTGKTTTARIIAKALNYTGADGKAGPTTGDTSDCSICQAIAEDRHPDVMEMDAASRTGIDDIREILDGVRYAPTSARYKIYIIDEIHMLSKQAFNALLKTLEEPPSHVKFIFATTEIRKVPVTILSRCQRFDLKRVEVADLQSHFMNICGKENVKAAEEAIHLIAQAADGSVRDGLSLLDQAMALGTSMGNEGEISAEDVATMLGATDRVMILDLLQASLGGKAQESIKIMHDLYAMGADPLNVIQDMMDMIHGLSILAVNKDASIDALPHAAMDQAKQIASQLTVPQLQKSWQVLLKGSAELYNAPNAQKAAEMIILRLVYAANLPDPSDLIQKIKDGKIQIGQAQQTQLSQGPEGQTQLRSIVGGAVVAEAQPREMQQNSAFKSPETIQEMIALFEQNAEMLIAAHLYQDIACVTLKPGVFEFKAYDNAPVDLAGRVRSLLKSWTGDQWMVSVVTDAAGAMSLSQQNDARKNAEKDAIHSNANVKAVLDIFPGAEVVKIFEPET